MVGAGVPRHRTEEDEDREEDPDHEEEQAMSDLNDNIFDNIFSKIPPAVRTKALAKPEPNPNPYLFDVRKDNELRSLLTDALQQGRKVNLPVGAYLYTYIEDQNPNCGYISWVLVSPKGETRLSANMNILFQDTDDWDISVRKFLGIEPKKTKTAKKTQTTKRSKR
jgi:hypothetical protein